jgi:hypothetical protein
VPPEDAVSVLQHNGDNVPPELRKQLLEMAREWMQAVIEQEDGSEAPQSE